MPRGFVNIQRYNKQGIVTGGDIHETLESAKRAASPFTVYQAVIEYPYTGETTCSIAQNVESPSKKNLTSAPTAVEKQSRKKKSED